MNKLACSLARKFNLMYWQNNLMKQWDEIYIVECVRAYVLTVLIRSFGLVIACMGWDWSTVPSAFLRANKIKEIKTVK